VPRKIIEPVGQFFLPTTTGRCPALFDLGLSALVSLPPKTTRIDIRTNVVFLSKIDEEYRDIKPKISITISN
jgi:hypothetical protein